MGERKYKVNDLVNIKTNVLEVDESSETGLGYRVRIGIGRSVWVGEYMLDSNKTYEQGLEEGWDLARKIVNTHYDERDKILGTNVDNHTLDDITNSFTAAQVKEKFEQYNRLHDIRVGDKVISEGFSGGTGLVTFINPVRKTADILLRSGKVIKNVNIKTLMKVSGHVDMDELLDKLWD